MFLVRIAIYSSMASNIKNSDNDLPKDYQFVEEPPDELTCPVCTYILLNPYEIETCGHVFCKKCVDQIIAKHTTG